MAQRTLDSSFWDDEDVAKLCLGERLLLICMFTDTSLSDDFGYLPANPKTLKKHAFGYDDDISTEQVQKWRDGILHKCDNVILYKVNKQEYISLVKFQQWQQLRYQRKSNIPRPIEDAPQEMPDEELDEQEPVQELNEIAESSQKVTKDYDNFPLSSVVLNSVELGSITAASAAEASPPDTVPRPKRKRKPREHSDAVWRYIKVTGNYAINNVQEEGITETVTDLDKWERVIRYYCLSHPNKTNVKGMLDYYEKGWDGTFANQEQKSINSPPPKEYKPRKWANESLGLSGED